MAAKQKNVLQNHSNEHRSYFFKANVRDLGLIIRSFKRIQEVIF